MQKNAPTQTQMQRPQVASRTTKSPPPVHPHIDHLAVSPAALAWDGGLLAPVGDMDRDGRTDVFIVSGSPSGYRWAISSAGRGAWETINTSKAPPDSLAFGDFDGDGAVEVFSRERSGQWLTWSPVTRRWSRLAKSGIPMSGLRFGDFDGDGKTDVLAISGGYARFSSAGRARWRNLGRFSGQVTDYLFGDFDGDARTDVFRVAAGGQWQMSPAASGKWVNLARLGGRLQDFRTADLDGDGRTDIYTHAGAQSQYASAGRSGWRTLMRGKIALSALRFGDFDGDGRADLFLASLTAPGPSWRYSRDGRSRWVTLWRPKAPAPRTDPESASESDPVPLPVTEQDPVSDAEPTGLPNLMTYEIRNALLQAHNSARAEVTPVPSVPLPPMVWDEALAATAQDWADNCEFQHNANRRYVDGNGQTHIPGENLAYTSASLSAAAAGGLVQLWVDEGADYDYDTNSCSGSCGHYTQVVWQTSDRIGCGVRTNCPLPNASSATLLVCNYMAHGNMNGWRPYSLDGSAPGASNVADPGPVVSATTPVPQPSAALAATPGFSTAPLTGMTPAARDALLELHNATRADVQPAPAVPLAPMVWDSGLEALAQSWADTCPTTHNPDRRYQSESGPLMSGENMAFRSPGFTLETLFGSAALWVAEASSYDYENNSCDGVCGHYTQVVWHDSTLLGCGIRTGCGSSFDSVLVCNYLRPGNFNNQRPYPLASQ